MSLVAVSESIFLKPDNKFGDQFVHKALRQAQKNLTTNNLRSSHPALQIVAAVAAGDDFIERRNLNFRYYQQKQKREVAKVELSNTEILSQVRKRREAEKLQQRADLEEGQEVPVWNYWRKKESASAEAKQLTKKIVELGKRRQLDKVFALIESAEKEKKKINVITMNACLAACVNCNEIDKAISLYYKMVRPNGVGADSITYGTLLKGLGQAKRLDDAFELLENMESKKAVGNYQLSDVHLNTLINACAENGEALRARGILSRYKKFGIASKPSTFTYNLLIKGYARSDNPLEALKVVDEMKLLNLPFDRLTFNSIILACIRGKDIDAAIDILDEMKGEASRLNNNDLLPDVVTYTTLLKGLSEEGDLEGLSKIVAEMKDQNNCEIDRVAYTAIIDAYITAGFPEEGMKIMKEMEDKAKVDPKLQPRVHVFLALLRAFGSMGQYEIANALSKRMVSDSAGQVFPEHIMEAEELVFESAVNSQNYSEAKKLLTSMVKNHRENLQFSTRAMHSIISLYSKTGYSMFQFQPIIISQEISFRKKVESYMSGIDTLPTASSNQSISQVSHIFFKSDFLVALDDNSNCTGVVYAKDCTRMDAKVSDFCSPLPPKIFSTSSIQFALQRFMETKSNLLTVIEEEPINTNRYYLSEDDRNALSHDKVLGFLEFSRLLDSEYLKTYNPLFSKTFWP